METQNLGFNSKLIHAGGHKDEYGSATVPIYQTSTFRFHDSEHGAKCFAGEVDGYIYTRIGNPTIKALENLVAELEEGYGGIATSSGMAAVNSIYFGLLNSGDHIVSTAAVYGPSRLLMEQYYSRLGIESTYINTANVEEIERNIKSNTKILYIETPSNPTMEITDLEEVVRISKKYNLISVVDNTFCSPYLQKPLKKGIDIVFHSITKFLNGHADIVGGIIVTKEKHLYEKLRNTMVTTGCNMDPHQAYMVIRGLKTLGIRIERSQQNAMKIAQFLENHPKIKWVKYPGLKSHPQHELAKKQMSGFGALISFEMSGGYEAGKKLMDNVKLCILAVSLGGVETLIQHPASMTHSKVPQEDRLKADITDGLIRLSVGIEDVEDIIADLEQALEKV